VLAARAEGHTVVEVLQQLLPIDFAAALGAPLAGEVRDTAAHGLGDMAAARHSTSARMREAARRALVF
jgi:hypothetical protein